MFHILQAVARLSKRARRKEVRLTSCTLHPGHHMHRGSQSRRRTPGPLSSGHRCPHSTGPGRRGHSRLPWSPSHKHEQRVKCTAQALIQLQHQSVPTAGPEGAFGPACSTVCARNVDSTDMRKSAQRPHHRQTISLVAEHDVCQELGSGAHSDALPIIQFVEAALHRADIINTSTLTSAFPSRTYTLVTNRHIL